MQKLEFSMFKQYSQKNLLLFCRKLLLTMRFYLIMDIDGLQKIMYRVDFDNFSQKAKYRKKPPCNGGFLWELTGSNRRPSRLKVGMR
jgi:hypothetical protein